MSFHGACRSRRWEMCAPIRNGKCRCATTVVVGLARGFDFVGSIGDVASEMLHLNVSSRGSGPYISEGSLRASALML